VSVISPQADANMTVLVLDDSSGSIEPPTR
jgi:hypothetical protein